MNQQYLKDLQQRAQRLLQLSSDDQLNYEAQTVTNRQHTPNYTPKHHLRQSSSDSQRPQQEVTHHRTDLELLKKCVQLANENQRLKGTVDEQSRQIERVEDEAKELRNILKKQAHAQMQYRHDSRVIQQHKQTTIQAVAEFTESEEQGQSNLHKTRKQLHRRYHRQQNLTEKEQQLIAVKSELSCKLEQSRQKALQLEKLLMQEKHKTKTLCTLIVKEMPVLKERLGRMTKQLDNQFQQYMLRDIPF